MKSIQEMHHISTQSVKFIVSQSHRHNLRAPTMTYQRLSIKAVAACEQTHGRSKHPSTIGGGSMHSMPHGDGSACLRPPDGGSRRRRNRWQIQSWPSLSSSSSSRRRRAGVVAASADLGAVIVA